VWRWMRALGGQNELDVGDNSPRHAAHENRPCIRQPPKVSDRRRHDANSTRDAAPRLDRGSTQGPAQSAVSAPRHRSAPRPNGGAGRSGQSRPSWRPRASSTRTAAHSPQRLSNRCWPEIDGQCARRPSAESRWAHPRRAVSAENRRLWRAGIRDFAVRAGTGYGSSLPRYAAPQPIGSRVSIGRFNRSRWRRSTFGATLKIA
jgi:hypothetical protein